MAKLNLRSAAVVLALGCLIGVPGQAAAHIRVTSSNPAANSTVNWPVREIRITFSQRVSAQYTRISVVNPAGVEVPVSSLAADSAGREFTANLAEPLANGTYRVSWRTAGADGHIVSGEYTFTVAAALLDTAVAAPVISEPIGAATGEPHAEDVNTQPVAVLARWSNFLALLLALGTVAFGLLVLPNIQSGSVPDSYWSTLNDGLRRVGILSAVLVLLAAVPRFLLQSALLNGAESMFEPGRVRVLLVNTPWGIGWLLQLLAGLALLFAAWLRARSLAIAGALALALSASLSGHAAGVERLATVAIGNDALHVLAAASWLGALALIVTLALPLAFRQGGNALAGLAAIVRAFSPVALIAASIIVLTGASAAVIQMTQVSQLWSTTYGRALLIKLGLVALVMGFGYYNNSRLRPRLGEAAATEQLRKSAALELAFGTLVLLVTAVLVALPTPH